MARREAAFQRGEGLTAQCALSPPRLHTGIALELLKHGGTNNVRKKKKNKNTNNRKLRSNVTRTLVEVQVLDGGSEEVL